MLKNYYWLIFLVFLLFSITGYSQTNLIQNGHFENWTGNKPDNWVVTNGEITRNQTDAISGSSAQIYDLETSQNTAIRTFSVNLEGGKSYVIKFNSKTILTDQASSSLVQAIRVELSHTLKTSTRYSSTFANEWDDNQVLFEVTESGWHTFRISTADQTNLYSEIQTQLIDNVRVFESTELRQNLNDKNSLIALYNSTGGENWLNSWDISSDMNFWHGVKLNDAGRVTELDLKGNNLVGTLPIEIGSFEELTKLNLTKYWSGRSPNDVTGIIPPQIGNLTKLETLNFRDLDLSGNLPASIGQLNSLKSLIITYNQLSGSLPVEIGNLENLEDLSLFGNNFTGTLPIELSQLSSLTSLHLSHNNFTGSIPSELSQISNLEELYLNGNALIGVIPSEFGLLSKLKSIILSDNEITGSIPSELGNLNQLEILDFSYNQLNGSIPSSFGQLTSLKKLNLYNNNLNGPIPSSIGQLSNLRELNLNSNQIEGIIPETLGTINNLNVLYLNNNKLSGDVPVFPNSDMAVFNIGKNQFIFDNIIQAISNHSNASYSNQANIGIAEDVTLNEGDNFVISVADAINSGNTYQWRKNFINIDGETDATLNIPDIVPSQSGNYSCVIRNPDAPKLNLLKNTISLTVNPIDDDNDGVNNSNDECPNTPTGETVNANGCSQSQIDDDNDGIPNNSDNCPNTPSGNTVDAQGCIVNNSTLVNYLQNFSFEDWSGYPKTPNNWVITNANSIVRNNMATDRNYSLELDLNNSLANKTEVQNESAVQLATNTAYTYAFDYKVERGSNISVEVLISKDGNPFGIPIAKEFTSFNDDGNWHTFSFDFDTNNIDEKHYFTIFFRANSSITGIVQIDNLRVLGDALPDADNDGVLDGNDLCPNTPPTALAVDENGCEINVPLTNLIEDPSFEDWSFGGGANLAKWGIHLIPGSSWNKNEDVSDNLEYSVELTTGSNGTNTSSIFQNDIQLYGGVKYVITIDYKVTQGTFNTLELNLTQGIFAESFKKFTTNPIYSGWVTNFFTFTPQYNEVVDLNINVISNLPQEHILLDNLIIKVYSENTDSDNDGIYDDNDNCPNTPSGETVDANGCSESQLDDDNDGVNNNLDTCPNTPTGTTVDAEGCPIQTNNDADNDGINDDSDNCPNTPSGETVDANGCSESQLDDDNDGVTNNNDICPNTPTGESVDTNGCSSSQLDDDNDGVFNNTDNCPNTPDGQSVSSDGCVENQSSLPDIYNNDIEVKVTSTTCPNTENGEIAVNLNKDYNYTVTITSTLLDNTFDNINSTDGLVLSNLSAGTYTVCVTITGFPSFEQCFSVNIKTPEEFITGKTVIDYNTKKATIVVSGSKNYRVLVNEKTYSYNFNDVANQQISFPLEKGENMIIIETDKICQGAFNDKILIKSAVLSPNPVENLLKVEGIENMSNPRILIANLSGAAAIQKTQEITNGKLIMDIANLNPGVYLLTILDENKEIKLKFVKK